MPDAAADCASVLSWLDLAHSATPVVALDRPQRGIVRCLIAPVPLLWLPVADRPARHPSRRVRCLAVDDAGNLAAPEAVFTGDAEALLACIRHHLSAAAGLRGRHDGDPKVLDTAAALRDPVNWRLWAGGPDQPLAVAWQWATQVQRAREREPAQAPPGPALQLVSQLGRGLQWCVDWVIGGLPGPLAKAMRQRPDLRHGLARRLLDIAERHGGSARRYVEQALLCEPLPVLRWIAEDAGLAQVLFDGRSLPQHLCREAGVSAAAVRHASRQANAIPELAPTLWLDVLAVLDRLPPHRRPFGPWQWGRLAALAGEVVQAADPRDPDARQVAIGAMLAGTRRLALGRSAECRPDRDWQGIFADAASAEQLATLICRLNRATSAEGPLAALRHLRLAADAGCAAADGGNLAARLVEALGADSAGRFGDLWLGLLPAVPAMRSGGCTLRLLRSMREVARCGRELRNCVDDSEATLAYLVSLRFLVSVDNDTGEPVGLASVLLERSGAALQLQLSEALGLRNMRLPAEAVAAAEEFVEQLAAEPSRFENFARVGEALARLGSRPER